MSDEVVLDLEQSPGTLAGAALYLHVEHLAVDLESEILLRALCEAIGGLIDRTRRVALGTDALRPGQLVWDPAVAELWGLRWTALLTGATLPTRRTGETDAGYLERARDAVIHVRGWRRATPAARKAAARGRLTGERRVTLTERYQGSAWRELIVTYDAETPTPELTLEDLLDPEAAVAGVRTVYRVDAGWSIGQMHAAYAGQTLGDLADDFPTIGDLVTHLPDPDV